MFDFIKNIFKKKNKGQLHELGGTIKFSKMSSKRADVTIEKKEEKPEPPKDRKVKGKRKNYGRKTTRNKKFYDKE